MERNRAPLSREFRGAASVLEALAAGRSLQGALDEVLKPAAPSSSASSEATAFPPASEAAVRDIAYSTCRRLGLVRALARQLNARRPPPALAALQWVALAQLIEPVRAEGIVVDQAVAAAKSAPGGASAAGFMNATLRRFLREREALMQAACSGVEARWNFPEWWVRQLKREWPAHWSRVLCSSNETPPMSLRVNRHRGSTDDYLRMLSAAGRGARRVGPQALVLDEPCAVDALPGWSDGWVSVQDAGAQLAAPLLDPQPGERILDACAAPGGKTTHLLELADCELTALDIGAARLAPLRENLSRLGQSARARVIAGDARRPSEWWDGKPFDRILVDAPCTASGIVRRHPDIRWLRRRSDLATLSRQQSEILAALWPVLRPGGKLLYATCSVFRAEGEAVVDHFLAGQPDASRQELRWCFGEQAAEPVSQLLPTTGPARDHDGFFYALLEKRL